MPQAKKTVMISSTARDLPEHREKVKDACLRQSMFPVMMEHLPASDAEAIGASLRMVDEADIYVGLFAHRYGYVPKGYDISVTEMEYNRAVERQIPRLIFVMGEDHQIRARDVEDKAADQLKAFKERVQANNIVNFFNSPDNLYGHVINGLAQLRLSERPEVKQSVQPVPAPLPLPPNGRSDDGKKLYLRVAAAALAVAILGAGLWKACPTPPPPPPPVVPDFKEELPLTKTDFRDQFEHLQFWTKPPSWSVNQGWLEIEKEATVGYLTDKRFDDFTMTFKLKLLNEGGAAWALRVNKRGYYLCYLSGPQGAYPNKFVISLMLDGQLKQVGTMHNVVRKLEKNGIYQIQVTAQKGLFTHCLKIIESPGCPELAGEGQPLDVYTDVQNVFPRGSLGFRAYGLSERFAVNTVMIFPPGTNPGQEPCPTPVNQEPCPTPSK